MKVVFLDVDGVLNSDIFCNSDRYEKSPVGFIGIDDVAVEHLKTIVDKSDAKIVLTSTWRLSHNKDYDYLKNKLKKHNLELFDEVGRTFNRALDIKDYIKANDIDSFVILDDEFVNLFTNENLNNHLVLCDYRNGLQDDSVEKALTILNK